jgi:hypothetical protein
MAGRDWTTLLDINKNDGMKIPSFVETKDGIFSSSFFV